MMNRKIVKRILAGVLSLAVVVAGFAYAPTEVQAEETVGKKWQEVDNAKFVEMITNHVAPEYTNNNENTGYLFAGWYTAEDGTPITSSEGITENVYAKFIPASLTGVACQVDLRDNTDKKNMRVVSLVDSDQYSAVGFNIYGRYDADGNGTNESEWTMYKYGSDKMAESTEVFDGLYEYKKSGDEWQKRERYPQDIFGEAATGYKFTTVSISKIPTTFFTATMVVQPYWVTLDGTYVEGMGEFNRISDWDDGIINISVNIKNATNIAAGLLDIKLQGAFENAEVVEIENGRVFDEFAGLKTGSKVRCIGNVSDITGHSATPNDVFVNLRIDKTSISEDYDLSENLGTNVFDVVIQEGIGGFSTNKEVEAEVSVWDVIY